MADCFNKRKLPVMNKNTLLLLISSLVAACAVSYQSGPLIKDGSPEIYQTQDQVVYQQTNQALETSNQQTNVIAQETFVIEEPQTLSLYQENASKYKNNVILKKHSQDFVSYEYKNVRIDEVASLAIRYCQETASKNAKLLEIVLRPNHSRLATFECIDL